MCAKWLHYTRNPGCRGTGKATCNSSFFPLSSLNRDWIKVNMGLGTPKQVTSQLQTLLDSWDTSLENTYPALLEKEVFFNHQGKALRVNKRSSVINPETIFAGTYCHLQFSGKAKAWMAGYCDLCVWWWDDDPESHDPQRCCVSCLSVYVDIASSIIFSSRFWVLLHRWKCKKHLSRHGSKSLIWLPDSGVIES